MELGYVLRRQLMSTVRKPSAHWQLLVLGEHVTSLLVKPYAAAATAATRAFNYSVSQKNPPPEDLWHFFQNGWEFLNQILYAYYAFPSTLDYEFFIQLSATLTKLCRIKRDHPACVLVDGGHFEHIMVVPLNMP